MSNSDISDEQLFLSLIADLTTQAWVSMGKIKNPITDKLERNIQAAAITIDLLDMLDRKTKGNRSESEDTLLTESLKQLKLNFIAESKKPDPETEETGEEEKPSEPTDPGEQDPSTKETDE